MSISVSAGDALNSMFPSLTSTVVVIQKFTHNSYSSPIGQISELWLTNHKIL